MGIDSDTDGNDVVIKYTDDAEDDAEVTEASTIEEAMSGLPRETLVDLREFYKRSIVIIDNVLAESEDGKDS